MLGRYKKARSFIERALQIDRDNPHAHYALGRVYSRLKNYEAASNCFLNSIELDFYQAETHKLLGNSLFHLGKYKDSANAFELALSLDPTMNNARETLIHLYDKYLDQQEKGKEHSAKFTSPVRGEIVIVSGLPRSGTSMMMQMLEKGGMQICTDGERSADENNPLGYFEHKLVKNLAKNNRWLGIAKGKALKVIANLLPHLSHDYEYKVIFMERNIDEVLASQRKMKERLNLKKESDLDEKRLKKSYLNIISRAKEWSNNVPYVEMLSVKYDEIVENPFMVALQIQEFLDYRLLPELMVQAVNPKLYREKSIENPHTN